MTKSGAAGFRLSDYDMICYDIGDVLFFDFPVKMAYSHFFQQHVSRHRPELDLYPWVIIAAEGHHEGALRRLTRDHLETANRQAWASVLEQWRRLFLPIATTISTLSKPRHKRLVLVANRPEQTLETIEKLGLDDLVDDVLLDTLVGVSTPDIRIFEMALSRSGVRPERAVMVGDRLDNDGLPAKRLGMATIWTQPCLYDPELAIPQGPRSWRDRYERGSAQRVRQAWTDYAALPSALKPDACAVSLSIIADEA